MESWLDVAESSYGAAAELGRLARWRSTISRSYYAAYARVSAALRSAGVVMPVGREGPSHRALPGLVTYNLRSLGTSDRLSLAGRMRRLYRLRVAADYEPSVQVDRTAAYAALSLMADVFRRLKEAR